jgi:hypothetical protein
MNRWHTTTGHGLLDMYRCETGPLDSDEGRRLKISGDCRFRDSAFNHSSDIRKGRPENIVEPVCQQLFPAQVAFSGG